MACAPRPRCRPVSGGLAQRTAMRRNIPVRQVLPDLAVLGIAQRQPSTEKELTQARGVDERFSRGKVAAEILAAVAEGKLSEPPDARPGGDDLERDLRPAVTLVSAWVSQVARVERIDASILATRSDLVSFLAHDPDARLARGWRGELLGDGLNRLIEGRATRFPSTAVTVCDWSTSADAHVRSARAHDAANPAPQGVEGGDRLGRPAAVGVDRLSFADRLVEDHAVGHGRRQTASLPTVPASSATRRSDSPDTAGTRLTMMPANSRSGLRLPRRRRSGRRRPRRRVTRALGSTITTAWSAAVSAARGDAERRWAVDEHHFVVVVHGGERLAETFRGPDSWPAGPSARQHLDRLGPRRAPDRLPAPARRPGGRR